MLLAAAHAAVKGADAVVVKAAYSAVVSVFLEGARADVDGDTLAAVLEDSKVEGDRSAVLVGAFAACKTELRSKLRQTGFGLPHVVGVDWRLDYHMKTNQLEKVNEPVFTMSFNTTDAHGVQAKEQLSCDLAQMQDLVAKLKDAQKRCSIIGGE